MKDYKKASLIAIRTIIGREPITLSDIQEAIELFEAPIKHTVAGKMYNGRKFLFLFDDEDPTDNCYWRLDSTITSQNDEMFPFLYKFLTYCKDWDSEDNKNFID